METLEKRRDIDGLRAVAVLAVITYHSFPSYMPGGFAGVDVFFVISGYLIGGILLKNIDGGQFSFREFYARRVRRIFPALILVLACCLAAGWRFMLPDEYKSLAEQAGAGAAFFANVLLWAQTGYFDADANLKPLLHLWSLGVEEQFYIVWPVILVIAHRCRLNILTVTLLLAAASFAANVRYVPWYPAATFFLPHSRIWEPLLGCLLAYAEHRHPERIQRSIGRVIYSDGRTAQVANLLSIAGIAFIGAAYMRLNSVISYPGEYALLPTVGAVLLISAGPGAFINRYFLGNRLMVSIGLISYPLYLWHWPLLSFTRIYETHAPSVETALMLIGASFALSIATYWLIEPVRYRKHRAVPAALALAMTLVATQSFATYRSDGFPSRTARFEKVEKAVDEWEYPTTDMKAVDFDGIPVYSRDSGARGSVLFIGDSNIEQYWPRIDQLITDSPATTKSATFMTRGGCPAIPGVTEVQHPLCTGFTDKVRHYLSTRSDIDTIVIGGFWVAYFDLLKTYRIQVGADSLAMSKEPGRTAALDALAQMMSDFRKSGKRVILVLNAPQGASFDPRSLVGRSMFGFSIKEGGARLAQIPFEKDGIRDRMVAAAQAADAEVIDPSDFLCSNGFCPAWTGDEPIYRDSAHIRSTFARSSATFIDQTVH
jgi:peptidoglycan/LPS O-acetylase OafA/YrhL